MSFYEDMEKSLLEAIQMENGNMPLVERDGMPAPTFYAENMEKELVDELVAIRKERGISQSRLAHITGDRQQSISRFEKKEHSPSLKMFCGIAGALGYELRLVRRTQS